MLQLEHLIGDTLTIAIRSSERGDYDVVLHGVEQGGGIWVESDELSHLLGYQKQAKSVKRLAKKPVFFVPFSEIHFLVASSVELDETSLAGE